MTRGEAVGKSNRHNSVYEATRANQKSTRGISLEDEMNLVGQPMILWHVARKDPCEWAVNYVFILDDPLNKGATDRILRNLFISNSSIGIIHDQERTMSGIITKETNKVSFDKNMVYSWRGPPWTIIRSSVAVVYRLLWSRPWTMKRNGRFNCPYNGRTNMQHLGKSDMLGQLINP